MEIPLLSISTKFCKAIILQLKNKYIKKYQKFLLNQLMLLRDTRMETN